jgi:hypothetical protein
MASTVYAATVVVAGSFAKNFAKVVFTLCQLSLYARAFLKCRKYSSVLQNALS